MLIWILKYGVCLCSQSWKFVKNSTKDTKSERGNAIPSDEENNLIAYEYWIYHKQGFKRTDKKADKYVYLQHGPFQLIMFHIQPFQRQEYNTAYEVKCATNWWMIFEVSNALKFIIRRDSSVTELSM